MKKFLFAFVSLLIFNVSFGYSQTKLAATNLLQNPRDFSFTPNRGQLADEKGNLLPDILYFGHSIGTDVYLESNKIKFVFTKIIYKEKAVKKTSHEDGAPAIESVEAARIEMEMVGANTISTIVTENEQTSYTNYHLAHTREKGINGVKSFGKITYKNIYPYIDLILESKGTGMEYSFLVHPGGSVSDIKMRWTGNTNQINENTPLTYSCSLGEISESAPVAYLKENKKDIIQVQNLVSKEEDDVINSFKVDSYDKTKDLTIDPYFVWGTYFGGNNDDYGIAVSTNPKGEVIITGYTSSSKGLATSGAYLTKFGGSDDVFLAKLTSKGVLLWSTYYGGSDYDEGDAVKCDDSGNIFMVGATSSKTGIATKGACQTTCSGYSDGFLAKFSDSGTLAWATYFGGKLQDYAEGVSIDDSGKIYVVGATESDSGIATSGAYQTTIGSTSYFDGFIAKFNSGGTLAWATYYGGSEDDYLHRVSPDDSGNIYVAGLSYSSSGIATSGVYQSSFGGSSDAFLAKFSSSGSIKWGTYFGGSDVDDATGLAIDHSRNLIIGGYTYSTSGIATTKAYQTSNAGSSDAFLAKFTPAGKISWASYYGGSAAEVVYDLASDTGDNIYIIGYSYSTTGIATKGAYQTKNNLGSRDAFLGEFTNNGSFAYGTYYGGTGDELGRGVATDLFGNTYLTGVTSSSSSIASKGAHQTKLSGTSDAFLVKFSESKPCSFTASFSGSATVCSNNPVRYIGSNYSGISYTWTASGGTIISGAGTDTVFVKWITAGKGSLELLENDATCKDSVITPVTINASPGVNAGNDTSICMGDSITIGKTSSPGVSYLWTSNPKGFTSTISNPKISPSTTSTFYLKDSFASGCSNTDSIVIKVNALPVVNAGNDTTVCAGIKVQLGSAAISNSTYSWVSKAGYSSTLANPVITATSTSNYLLSQKDTLTGCSNMDSVLVTVNPLPSNTHWSATKTSGRTYAFLADDTSLSASSYSWDFGDGGNASGFKTNHIYSKDSSYTIQLTITNAYNCSGSHDSALSVITGISTNSATVQNLNIFPNPFSGFTNIEYSITANEMVKAEVYDMLGRRVAILANEEQISGKHTLKFEGNSSIGQYILRMQLGDEVIYKKIVEVK